MKKKKTKKKNKPPYGAVIYNDKSGEIMELIAFRSLDELVQFVSEDAPQLKKIMGEKNTVYTVFEMRKAKSLGLPVCDL